MESIVASLSSVNPCEYTDKQKKLLDVFDFLISRHEIKLLQIDSPALEIQSPVAVDVEHDEAGHIVCIGAYDGVGAYCWTSPDVGEWINRHLLIMHNGVSDIELLRAWGIPVSDSRLYWDTLLIGHILDSSKKAYGLKDMAKRELDIEYPSYDDIVGKRTEKQQEPRVTLDKQPPKLVAAYNAMDCYVTYKLYERQRKACENL